MDWRRRCEPTGWKERIRNEEWRGARKRTPEKQNDKVNSKIGLMKKKPWNVEMEDRKKTTIRDNDKPRVVLKKEPWAETKTTFAKLAQPKTTERETKNTTSSDEKKVTTTKQKPTRKGKKETPNLKTLACKEEE